MSDHIALLSQYLDTALTKAETYMLITMTVGFFSVIVNVLLVGLVAKLYTEYFKAVSISKRETVEDE